MASSAKVFLSVSVSPPSISAPSSSRVAVTSCTLSIPLSPTVNSPSMLRTGMPFWSAGAARLLVRSMEPSSASPFCGEGTMVASKSRSVCGAEGTNSARFSAWPLIRIWSICSSRLFSNGPTRPSALRLTLPPAKSALKAVRRKSPDKRISPPPAMPSSSAPPRMLPCRAKGEAV